MYTFKVLDNQKAETLNGWTVEGPQGRVSVSISFKHYNAQVLLKAKWVRLMLRAKKRECNIKRVWMEMLQVELFTVILF